ncbi:uncharacterized protein LOC123506495 [Portunus trituberculatus]|uniref:uncharacterized protein LOC123506495 n=1 Tax=Portunus trituberculatus TaxID=210409 RepID=UPI001E1D1CCB|nr:uncharacterized protein LOC123506495 [Portunus trituberculatus]
MWRRRQQGSAIYVVLRMAVALLAIGVLLVLLAGRPTDNRMTNGGGAPSVLLWTMMRSGSRMTQYLLTAQPCSFPAEEPLRRYLRKKDLNASVSVLQDLLDCRFSDRSDNLTGWVNESYMSDPAVWRLCHAFPRVCWDGRLVDALCKASCLRLVRVVNEGLALALSVLQDSSSNTHIVHLVRDPRGMLSSRRELQYGKFVMFYQQKKTDFFRNSEIDVNVLCQRYHHDLAVATHLNRHYPDRRFPRVACVGLNRRRNRVHRTARLVVLVLITTLLPAMVAVSNHPSADGDTMGDSVGAPAVSAMDDDAFRFADVTELAHRTALFLPIGRDAVPSRKAGSQRFRQPAARPVCLPGVGTPRLPEGMDERITRERRTYQESVPGLPQAYAGTGGLSMPCSGCPASGWSGWYTLVRYEDIARQPHRETRRLYSFMGLEYTPLVASVVSKQTLGFYHTEGKDHPFATSKNSSSSVFAWRSRLSYSEVERVQQECGDVLRAYGYRHFSRRQYEKEAASPLLPLPAGWATPLPANRGDN